MKTIIMDGLAPKIVEMDYKFLCEQKKKYEEKGKEDAAKYLAHVIAKIDEAVADGEELSADLIETVVNRIIDKNEEERRLLKSKMKKLNQETIFLKSYSEREMEEIATIALIASI